MDVVTLKCVTITGNARNVSFGRVLQFCERKLTPGVGRGDLTLQRLVYLTFQSSLLEKQNRNNEVPLFPSVELHALFSSQYLRYFSRFSIPKPSIPRIF